MADFSTTFNPKIADFLAKYVDADGSKSSVQIVSSGGDSTSVELSMSTSLSEDWGEDWAQSTLLANAEIDGNTVSATADAIASGETASTLVNMEADLSEDSAQVEVVAEAESEAEAEGTATAMATTDVQASGFQFVNVAQFPSGGEPTEDGWEIIQTGDNPVAVSGTYLEASNELMTLEQPSLTWEETSQETTLIDMGGWLLQ